MRLVGRSSLLCGFLALCLAAPRVGGQNSTIVATPVEQGRRPVPAPNAFLPSPPPTAQAASLPVDNPVTPNFPTLIFDAETKQYNAKPGEPFALFTFHLTNVWTNEVRIDRVHPSCGCTTAKLPPVPWHIPPGGTGNVDAQINLAGKSGLVTKTLTFNTSVGNRILTLKVQMPPPGIGLEPMSAKDRNAAMALAAANPQAIFRGDCAKCHVDQGAHSFGQDLYAADCGICHESSHRASAVPDLHALKEPTNLEFWKTMITFGKPHTMMPGFAATQGGPLNNEQINSLATYLDHTISHHFLSAQSTNTVTTQ